MTNKTQCPNCLTVYIITDEQYEKSKGKVRCGTCRQPFVANFLPEQAPAKLPGFRHDPLSAAQSTQENTGAENSAGAVGSELVGKSESAKKFEAATPNFFEEPLSSASIEAMLDSAPIEPKVSSVTYSDGFEENLHSELTIEIDESNAAKPRTDELISQVDELIEEKLIEDFPPTANSTKTEQLVPNQDAEATEETETVTLDEPFLLDPSPPRGFLRRWVAPPIAFASCLILVAILMYQLWLRQALPFLEDEALVETMNPLVNPAREYLDERFDLKIPIRRDLANLRLLSARVEPHPVRSSTTLLKVSLVNTSAIAQPYPWLELVLSDEDGQLVARRSLSPADYLHNNRLRNLIRPKELRPVTIELLAFPRQAHGYELKIVNRT